MQTSSPSSIRTPFHLAIMGKNLQSSTYSMCMQCMQCMIG